MQFREPGVEGPGERLSTREQVRPHHAPVTFGVAYFTDGTYRRRLRRETLKFESLQWPGRRGIPYQFFRQLLSYPYSFWASENRRRCLYNETRTRPKMAIDKETTLSTRAVAPAWPRSWLPVLRKEKLQDVSNLDHAERASASARAHGQDRRCDKYAVRDDTGKPDAA